MNVTVLSFLLLYKTVILELFIIKLLLNRNNKVYNNVNKIFKVVTPIV